LVNTALPTKEKLVPVSQQYMPNMTKKHLEVNRWAEQMKSDDIVLTQAILPLLFHWKSSKNKPQKMKKIWIHQACTNTWTHLHRDNHFGHTIYSLCPIKQFSIAFLESSGDIKIIQRKWHLLWNTGMAYNLLNIRTAGHPSTWHHTGNSIGLQHTTTEVQNIKCLM